MFASVKPVIVIPTRNRADLAQNAIKSVLDQSRCNPVVIVSDNSTIALEVEKLRTYCETLNDARVKYVRPHTPLPMPDHWEWALVQALAMTDVSHLMYLTDRMVF